MPLRRHVVGRTSTFFDPRLIHPIRIKEICTAIVDQPDGRTAAAAAGLRDQDVLWLDIQMSHTLCVTKGEGVCKQPGNSVRLQFSKMAIGALEDMVEELMRAINEWEDED